MNKILRDVLDAVFSFGGFILLLIAIWVYFLITVFEKESQERELTKVQTAYCYSLSMVRVKTDAGFFRCVAPNALVEVK